MNVDNEGDPAPVSLQTRDRTKRLLIRILEGVTRLDKFTLPSVTSDCHGHLHLLWGRERDSCRLLIIAAGYSLEEVAVIETPAGGQPSRQVCATEEAAHRVLRFLGRVT
jgi:hypothetical protein